MKLWRVTGWQPETGFNFNVGLFFATSRDAAIAKASCKRNSALVLDACAVETARELQRLARERAARIRAARLGNG